MKVINRIYIHDDRLKNIISFTMELAHFRNMLIILELNKLSFKVIDRILQIKLHKNKKIKLKLPKLIKEPSSIRITHFRMVNQSLP